jgi:hypothetical protein
MRNIVITLLSLFLFFHSFSQKNDLNFELQIKKFATLGDTTLARASIWIEDYKTNIQLDTNGRIKSYSLDSKKYKFKYTVDYNDSTKTSTSFIEVIESKGKNTTIHYIFFKNDIKFIEGKTINHKRVGSWKTFDLNGNVIGKVVFTTKNKNYQENCVLDAFECSYIEEEIGESKDIVEFNWKRF